jgi:hypothetical protein
MKEIRAALLKAQAEIGAAIKDKTNPAFKSKYEDLGAVLEAVKPALQKNGLILLQDIRDGHLVTLIAHPDVEEMLVLCPVPIKPTKDDMQGYGSAITYARRYSLKTAFAVPSEDDDGHAAAASAPKLNQWSARGSALQGIEVDWPRIKKIAAAIQGYMTNQPDDWEWKVWEEVEQVHGDDLIALAECLQAAERSTLKKIMVEQRKKAKEAAARLMEPGLVS